MLQRRSQRCDPATLLNTDCMNLIFSYLVPDDIIRCEFVSKGWRDYTRAWMVSFGIRLHCHLADIDTIRTVKFYKLLGKIIILRRQRTLRANMLEAPQAINTGLGRSTSAKGFWDHENSFRFAGRYAASFRYRKIRWYLVERHGDLSSIYPPEGKLLVMPGRSFFRDSLGYQGNYMEVNSDGYLFTRVITRVSPKELVR